jgi:hypothetical protein
MLTVVARAHAMQMSLSKRLEQRKWAFRAGKTN